MRRIFELAAIAALSLGLVGWEPLWRNQPDIEDGIEAYGQKKWDEALSAFERAAKEIPDTPEIHLNRGVALYQKAMLVDAAKRFGPLTTARDELQRAMAVDGPEKKAAVWHSIATCVTQLALLTTKEDKDGPKGHDREERIGLAKTAIDGFKKALEQQSGDVDTKWNLEVAQRLLDALEDEKKREEEQKKQQNKDQQKQDQQKQDQQKQDQQKQDQQKQDQQKQDQQKQDQQKQDQQKQDQQKQDQQKQDQQKQDQQKQDQQKQDQQKQDQQKQDQQKQDQQKQDQPGEAKKAPPLDLAPLEALKNSEKPLQLYRIMMDPRKSGLKVKKDW